MASTATQQVADALIAASHLFALPVEKNFQPDAYIAFASNNWPLCIGLVIGYMVVIFTGRRIMENRPAFELRIPLALWNAALSLFSFIGMWRTVSKGLTHRIFTFFLTDCLPFSSIDALPPW
jgi:hypothetical protein